MQMLYVRENADSCEQVFHEFFQQSLSRFVFQLCFVSAYLINNFESFAVRVVRMVHNWHSSSPIVNIFYAGFQNAFFVETFNVLDVPLGKPNEGFVEVSNLSHDGFVVKEFKHLACCVDAKWMQKMPLSLRFKILEHLIADQRAIRKEGPISFSLNTSINSLLPKLSWVVSITEVQLPDMFDSQFGFLYLFFG